MPANKSVTDSEFELMKILWESDKPLTAQEIMERLESKEWKITTVSTLLTRLCEKGAADFEKRGRSHYYYPVFKETDYKISATKSLVSRVFGGSVKNLVAALYDNKEMSDEDVKEIKEMFGLD
ncbi:MAG: BlaI/MecI/CopY family transcriptional regulator [Oscillospiraceae bacterium]|nr:BlaI/MecI/CopY family transcriptional regulator [Oscillospiraceae bacterium]